MAVNTALYNHTPFAADTFIVMDEQGQEALILVVRATFQTEGAVLKIADAQPPVKSADEYTGDPAHSSLMYEADVSPTKPLVDVLVNGSAYAPRGIPAAEVYIRVNVGDVSKDLVVSGDRSWKHGPFGVSPSDPEPFLRMPVVFERAFGGTDRRDPDSAKHLSEPRNPVGVGFRGAVSADPSVGTEVPNVEYPAERLTSPSDRPRPASLGVVGRGWEPRISFAGTYDDKWKQERWPVLPEDFDFRFYQSAPTDQQSSTLNGSEPVSIHNMTPEGIWTFTLPTLTFPVRYYFDKLRSAEAMLRVDTVMLEPDYLRCTLVARACVRTVRNTGALREIVLGHMNPGWLRARSEGKLYRDSAGLHGARTDIPPFV